MTVVQETAMTSHNGHQYRVISDSMECIDSDPTMEDLEYQVDNNNIVYKVSVHVVS